jgi:hypothetical protein
MMGTKFGGAAETAQKKRTVLCAYIVIKFCTRENFGQLIHRGLGNEQDAMVQSLVNGLTWNGEGQHDCADEYVCVDDDAI